MGKTSAKAIKNGYKACSIFPINDDVVIAKIPREDSTTCDAVETVGQAVTEMLARMRYGKDDIAPQCRRRRLETAPGKSISS